jgi:hypothetical protein
MNKTLFATAAACLALSAGSAMAAWPTSVVGTWNAMANQSPLTLAITSQGTTGGCRAIAGTIADTVGGQSNTSGRLQFLRNNSSTNDTFQVYTANVSITGTHLYIGGTFAEDQQVGALGEYNFSASK